MNVVANDLPDRFRITRFNDYYKNTTLHRPFNARHCPRTLHRMPLMILPTAEQNFIHFHNNAFPSNL